MEHDWNPMNQALLNDKDLPLTKKKTSPSVAVAASLPASPSADQALAVADKLNLDTGAAATTIDVIFNH